MKKMKLIFGLVSILTLILNSAEAQYSRVRISDPAFVINLGDEYATLGSQRSSWIFGTREFYFYQSDEYGTVAKRRFRLDGWAAVDSAYAIANLPSGWVYAEPPCNIVDGYLVSTWDVTGDELKLRYLNDSWWMTQVVTETPDAFVVRGISMIDRTDVTIINELANNCLTIAPESGLGGLYEPDGFTTPSGYEMYLASNGTTKIYTSGTPPSNVSDTSFAYPVADVNYDVSGNVSTTRQSFTITESGSTRTLVDSQWATGFCSGCGTRYAYVGISDASVASARSFASLDVTDLAGLDIAPLTIYGSGASTDDYSQAVVHIKADAAKPRRTYVNGDYTYRWMPEEYEFTAGLYPSYQDYLPDFDLPAGKIGNTQFEFEPQYPNYLENNKGWTYTKTKSNQYRHWFDYDYWALSLGMPVAYAPGVTDADRNLAFDNISEANFISSFNTNVMSQQSSGLVELNFEVFVGLDKNKQKLKNIFNVWKNADTHALLSFWTEKGGIKTNRIQWESETSTNRIAPDIDWTGDYSSWNATRANNGTNTGASIFGANYGFVTEYADILYVNDLYQTRPDNTGWLHEAVGNTLMNRKFYPNHKIMWMDFPSIEIQVEITTANVAYVEYKSATDGQVYKFKEKPLVDPAEMWSRALYAYALADGMEQWTGPYVIHDDPYYYGSKDAAVKDQSGTILTAGRYKDYGDGRNGGRFKGRTLKGLDWHVAAAYAVSENADIIESNTSWTIPEYSMDGGATYRTGTQGELFATSAVNEELLPFYKEKADGTAGLLLIKNPSQDALTEVSYKVKINGVVHDVFQVGGYASIIRIALNNTELAPVDPGDNFTSIGDMGYKNGGNYFTEKAEVVAGVSRFNYAGNVSPDNSYPSPNPDPPTGTSSFATYSDDYVLFNFPSHSINYTDDGFTPKVYYQVWDAAGNMVLEVYDTKGGNKNSTSTARDNNHPDECARWLKKGTYRIRVQNISTDDRTIRFRIGTSKDADGDSIMAADIAAGGSYEYTYNYQEPEGLEWHTYKMNVNAY